LDATLQWAVEIELALVSAVWHHPEYVGLIQQELVLDVHLTLPCNRRVLESISILINDHDPITFETVVAVICELPGAFGECGGKEGLNGIFADEGRCPYGLREPEPFIKYYIGFLKDAALHRGVDPTKPLLRKTNAHGVLQLNKLATKPEHPTITGKIYVPVPGTYSLAGWPRGESQVNIKGQLERSLK
jgi:hypothetical protein